MKKAVQLLLVVAMIATSASAVFADAKINAWGRGIFAPAVSGAETTPSNGTSWGKNARIGWTINAQDADGNVGFKVDMNCDGGNADSMDDGHERIGLQDEQKVWAKPIPIVTVEIGRSIFYQTLRGDAAFGVWNYMRFDKMADEDCIFQRGKAGAGDESANRQNGDETTAYGGTLIHLDTAGIHVFAALNQCDNGWSKTFDPGTPDDDTDDTTVDSTEIYTTSIMLQRGQYGAGYEIPNVGLVRAQYIGKAYVDAEDIDLADTENELTSYGVLNAAVKLDKLVPNLYVDLGTFIPTKKRKDTGADCKEVNLYVKYAMGNMTFHFTTQTKLDADDPGKNDDSEKVAFHIGAGADIGIGNGLTINADVRYFDKVWMENDDKASVGFLAGVAKGFSNGKIAAGFEFITGYSHVAAANNSKEKDDDSQWAIPIVIEYWF